MNKQAIYCVLVGNVGTVHTGTNRKTADKEFVAYMRGSKAQNGRVGSEDVCMTKNGGPRREFIFADWAQRRAERKTIPLRTLFLMARGLKTDDGFVNTEYDRALVELCNEARGRVQDELHITSKELGVAHDVIYSEPRKDVAYYSPA